MFLKKLLFTSFFFFQNTFAGEFQTISKLVNFFDFGPNGEMSSENLTFNKQVQNIMENIPPYFLSNHDYKINFTKKCEDKIFISAYILSIIFWEQIFFKIISYLDTKDEEVVALNQERKILSLIKKEKIKNYQYLNFLSQRLSSVLNSEPGSNIEDVFSVIKNNLYIYATDFILNKEGAILRYFSEETTGFYIKNFFNDIHNFSNKLIDEEGPGPDREIFHDLTPFYGNLLIKMVHGWFSSNIENEASFIKKLLGQKLYISLSKKVKQEPKKEIKISDFDRFKNSLLLQHISNNDPKKIKELFDHVISNEESIFAFSPLNMAFSIGVVSDKNESIGKFKKLLEDTNFSLENLNFSLIKENWQSKKTINKQPLKKTKKKKRRKNNKTKENKDEPKPKITIDEDLGLYQPHKIQEMLNNDSDGFSKPIKNFKNKNNQRKRYVIKNQVETNEDLLNKEEISHLYLELDRANQDIFSSITVSLEELRKLILLLSGKKLFNKKDLFDLVNKYKIALFFYQESYKVDTDLKRLENFLLPNIPKKEISLIPVPENIVFEIDMMLNSLVNNSVEDQAESYYLYKEEIKNNKNFILTNNSINFDYRMILDIAKPFLNESLALKQLYDFHRQLVNRYWRLQIIIVEHLLASLGVIDNTHLVENKLLVKWQNFFSNLLNTSINWQEFCKEMTVKLEDKLYPL